MLSWLAQKGPHATKHHSWAHPIAVLLIHYTVLLSVSLGVHDWVIAADNNVASEDWNMSEECQALRQRIGFCLAGYSTWLFFWRLVFCAPTQPRQAIVYEYNWLCNGTLVMGAVVCFTHRPVIATACCVTIGIDQLLWYVDAVGYLVSGKFPTGVMKYLTWPETSWVTRVTCTHHLWTIPVLLTATGGSVPWSALPLAFVLMSLNVCMSRFMIPFEAVVPSAGKDKPDKRKYLNVNLSHELWKDIQFEFLQINYDSPPVYLYILRLLWRWHGFNTIVFGILLVLGQVFFAGDHHVCKP